MSADNPLKKLRELGQSVWYDYIRRDLYATGELERLIREDGLAGMTSNPTIFQKAIAETELYDEDVRRAGAEGKEPFVIFDELSIQDVTRAADVFRPIFDRTNGGDGYVSIEVGPKLASDTEGSIKEAHRLWDACARPNVMVKIPGTAAGVPAIRRCLADGVNINITLLFSVSRYREVMEAYLSALEERVAAGRGIESLHSVASFFVSRVDTNVDKKLDKIAKEDGDGDRGKAARAVRGKAAIANARLAYQAFREVFGSPRFASLARRGARIQRPLWASTSTKDPSYPDLYYVEALIAPDTVDTMPPETFAAYREHGNPQVRIYEDLDGARRVFPRLEELGIDEPRVSRELEEEGVKKFSDSYESLIKTLAEKEKAMRVA
ncbi:MAG TPA: transaldolase [Thermoanaerobaculia bacterium]|jgi:transaldolase|nr:transaldolase [Thermoanaerobaculia bacterium]